MSEGTFVNMRPGKGGESRVDESTDTFDTIDWLVKNLPNNGRVGMYGISYPGFYTAAGLVDDAAVHEIPALPGDDEVAAISAQQEAGMVEAEAEAEAEAVGAEAGASDESDEPVAQVTTEALAAKKEAVERRAADRAADRSKPDRRRPVSVMWTWASTNAGVTNAPARSTTSSTRGASSSAPSHAIRPSRTSSAVACGRPGQ